MHRLRTVNYQYVSSILATLRVWLLAIFLTAWPAPGLFAAESTLAADASAAASDRNCSRALSAPIVKTPYGDVELESETAIAFLQDQEAIAAALKLSGEDRKQALRDYFSQRQPPQINFALTFANYLMALGIGVQVATGMAAEPASAVTAALLVAPTLWVVDFVSAAYHKFLDSFASENNPIGGRSARAFRIHHEFPSNLNELSYLQNVSAFSKLMAPLYVATLVAAPDMRPEVTSSLLLALLLFSNGTEIHRQAHNPAARPWVKKMQSLGLFLNRKRHIEHHRNNIDSDYGIVNGWTNRMTARLWGKLDMVFWKALRRMPHNWIQSPRSIPPAVIQELMQDLSLFREELLISTRDSRNSTPQLELLIRTWLESRGQTLQEAAP